MRVGLTTGDPNGIGVETILKTFQDDRMFNSITPILYASEKLVEHNMKVLEIENLNVNIIDSADKAKKGKLNIVKACSEEFSVTEGELSSDAGAYSFSSLKTAVEDLASTKFDVLVTAPINKDAITQAGFKFPGHTEYLADFANADDVLKIYSERQPMLIEPLLNEFESQTGIDVEWIYSKKGLVQKIILEKDKPVADVFLASDISRLIDVAEAGASIKINNSSAVPSHLQSDNWIGLTQRARIIYVNKDLGLNDITYEDLVSEKYK